MTVPTAKNPPAPAEQRAALTRLLIFVGLAVAVSVVTGTIKTVAIVVALIVMVMLHEFGHSITARWGGMKVTEFFVGFGPRLWSVRKGETEYGVKAIPAGGYCKIIGMNNLDQVEDPADEPRTYREQTYPRRLAVGVAGSAMHFIIALILLWTIHAVVGLPEPTLRVGEIIGLESGLSPAQEAGFQLGDKVVSIDGHAIARWADVPQYIRARPGESVRFVVERGGARLELVARPIDLAQVRVKGVPIVEEPTGFIGVGPQDHMVRASPIVAVGRAGSDFAEAMSETGRALGRIFSPNGASNYLSVLRGRTVQGDPAEETRFLSPVGFVRIASQAASTGLYEVLWLLVLINIFVGAFNLLPLLPLDGGHVAIATYEEVRSRIARQRYRVDVAKLMPVTYVVFLLMVFLGATSLYLDIVRPIANPFSQ